MQDAPERAVAGVGQDPVGFWAGVNDRETFFRMFEPTVVAAQRGGMQAVVDAALEQTPFVRNNAAGPFAPRIAADADFRADVLALDPAEYADLIQAYDDQLWGARDPFMSVEEAFVRACPRPLLILPGIDEFHPTEIAMRICAEAPDATCLEPDGRAPEKIERTRARVLDFLREHGRALPSYEPRGR
jgi:hypothetical protein